MRMPQLTYLEAIRQGIWEEMAHDPTVFCLGEDIGIYGGAFKVTDGFIDAFGPERVIDTPIAESPIVGAAFGASLTGMRPVAEFQFMDFIGCAFNQISNMVIASMAISAFFALFFLRALMMVFKPRFIFGSAREALFAETQALQTGSAQ